MRRFLLWALPAGLLAATVFPSAPLPGPGGGGPGRALAAAPAAARVQVAAQAGFEGRASLDGWAPVVVEVTNQGAAVTGQLIARQSRGAGGPVAEYSVPLALPEGARKRLTLTVPAQQGARGVDVVFAAGGQELAATNAVLQVGGPDDLLVGVLSREPLALSALGHVKLAGRAGNVRLVHLAAETLPDNLTLLANFDLLALARFDTARLSPAQTGALAAWVRRGGLLVLVGGPDWRTTLAGLPPELVPVRAASTRTVDDLPVLAALGARELPPRGRPFALTTGTLIDGRALALDGTDPVIAVGRVGDGTVLFFAVDLTLDPFAAWGGATTMWETLLLQYRGAGFWSTGTGATGNPALMARALSNQPMLSLPDLKRMGIWLLGYVLAVGPLGYGALALLRRRGAIWLLVPVASLGALSLLYYQGFIVEKRGVMSRAVSVTEITPGMATTASRTYLAVFAPSRDSLRVDLNPGDLAAPLTFPERAPDNGGEVIRVHLGERPAAEMAGLNMWSQRGLLVDREVPGLEGLALDLTIQGARLAGTVTNGTALTIREAVIVTPSGHESLADLKPGAVARVDTSLSGYSRSWQPVFQDIFSGPNSIKDIREQVFRRQVLEASVGATRDALPAPIMFLGWLDEPPAPLVTLGRQVAGSHLVYASVQPRVDPRNYDLPHGLIIGKLVASEGEQRGRSPRGYFLQEGALTFSLRVPDVDRGVLREVNLQVETGGSEGSAQIKLLNWQTGKWEEVGAQGPARGLEGWNDYLARDGSLLVRVEVAEEGQEIRAPTISLRGR